MAYLLTPRDAQYDIRPAQRKFTLGELRELVGGYIEIVLMRAGMFAVVNRDGLALGLEPNHEASALIGQSIVGNALICKRSEV